MGRYVLFVMVLAACEKKTPRFEGPLRVELGDCADAAVWVSGPRPLPIETQVAKAEPEQPVKGDPEEGGEGAFASLTGTGEISSGFDDTTIYGGLLGSEAGEMTGGWGTIGTGRYGTIGHGSGTGYGSSMRGRSANLPTIRIGQPEANGDLDKAIIRRYIKRNLQKIQYCYEKQLLVKAKLAGVVQTEFFIGPDGKVASSKAVGVDTEVASCIANVIKLIEFPKPKGGGGVQVRYPFTLRPTDSDLASTPPATPATPATPAAGVGSDQPEDDPPPPPTKPEQPAMEKPTLYVAGTTNPLRSELPALEECFRTNPKPHGVATVKLGTSVEVHGVVDDVAKCVREVAAKLTGAKPQVCSIAFGVAPIAELPAVEITADAIKYGGVLIADPRKEIAEGSLRFKIDALFERIEAAVKRDSAITTPLSVIGPLVVRPLDATPIAVVSKVTTSIHAGGGDYVLAAEKGTDWRILHAVTPPVVPVPLGTGGGWSVKQTKPRAMPPGTDEHVKISILVTKERIWVGLSRVNEFYEVPMLATKEPDWDKLEHTLKEQKRSAFFADRSDIEVAGELVTYGDVVRAIDVAIKVGFVDFSFSDPAGLAARPTL